ncbi:MAG: EamA family transporter, partial [Gemmatimonadales bacterium]
YGCSSWGTTVATAIAAAVLESVHMAWSAGLIAALLFTGVLATAIALMWQMRAQRHMTSARAAMLLCCEPVFAALASGMVLAVVGESRPQPSSVPQGRLVGE